MKDLAMIWDFIVDYLGVSEETLKIVTSINGYNEETLNDVIYAVSGYHSMEQYTGEEDEEDEEEETS